MGASAADLLAERLRLQRDPVYFDTWVTRIYDWHDDVLGHLQHMRDTGHMDVLLGPDIEIE